MSTRFSPPSAPDTSNGVLRSALYTGTVHHRRRGSAGDHAFSSRLAMPLLDLAELAAVAALHPLWSAGGPAPIWFRRADFHGDPDVPLDHALLDLVEARSGHRPAGPVAQLAHVRTWGWLFNPISLAYCYGPDKVTVESLVAEVENTPWHERHAYVVGPPGRHRFAKAMHVSPFLAMDLDYELSYTAPGERLRLRIDGLDGGDPVFTATLDLRRQALTRRSITRLLTASPAMTHRVSAGIYAEAARLAASGTPFHSHPERNESR